MAYSNVPGGEQSLDQVTLEQFVRSFVYLAGDAFGRMRVSQLVAIGDYKFTKDLLPLKCGTRLTAARKPTQNRIGFLPSLAACYWPDQLSTLNLSESHVFTASNFCAFTLPLSASCLR